MVSLTVKQTGSAVPNQVYIGNTQVPIQQAVNYAKEQGGGTIFIEKGRYNIATPINLFSNIKVHGEYTGTKLVPTFANSGNNAVFSCVGTASVPLECITVEALRIGGDSVAGKYGIYCSYVGKAATTGLSGGGYDSSTVGSSVVNKVGITIKDCIVQKNSSNGIYLHNSSNNTITGNIVQNNTGSGGIYLYTSSNNNTITGNTVQNNSNYGIELYISSNNNTITGNIVQNNRINGIYLTNSSNNNTITGNTVQNSGNSGIHIYNSNNNTITGNTSQNNGNNGIYLHNSINNTITGNTSQNNSIDGIHLSSSSKNNTVTGNIYKSISISGSGNLNASTHNQIVT